MFLCSSGLHVCLCKRRACGCIHHPRITHTCVCCRDACTIRPTQQRMPCAHAHCARARRRHMRRQRARVQNRGFKNARNKHQARLGCRRSSCRACCRCTGAGPSLGCCEQQGVFLCGVQRAFDPCSCVFVRRSTSSRSVFMRMPACRRLGRPPLLFARYSLSLSDRAWHSHIRIKNTTQRTADRRPRDFDDGVVLCVWARARVRSFCIR